MDIKKNSTVKRAIVRYRYLFLAIVFLIPFITVSYAQSQNVTGNTSLDSLNSEIETIKSRIKDLENQKEEYEVQIDKLQKERISLIREIDVIDNRIAQKGLEIEAEQARIDQTKLEIQEVEGQIRSAEKELESRKVQLGFVLDKLHREDVVDYFQIFLLNDSFADFFDAIKGLEDIQGDVHQLVNDVKQHKETLEEKNDSLRDKNEYQEQLKLGLEERHAELLDQQSAKQFLVSTTRYDERRFQGLIAEIRQEQERANADIVSLEREVRDQLERDQVLSSLGGDEEFAWPVNSRIITARFHDPSYPYRYVFEHPAVDIAVPQGTPVRATKSGYVGRAKDSGLGYSYILLIHDDGMSSVYGHVSQISVREDEFVVQGQIIGASGGRPGTPGAGSFSTGPHLHFELRSEGIPVDPENFLL